MLNKLVGMDNISKDNEIAELKRKIEEIQEEVRAFQNPYPKDIFGWDNSELMLFMKNGKDMPLTRGRFNQMCFEIVENTRADILEKIKEMFKK